MNPKKTHTETHLSIPHKTINSKKINSENNNKPIFISTAEATLPEKVFNIKNFGAIANDKIDSSKVRNLGITPS